MICEHADRAIMYSPNWKGKVSVILVEKEFQKLLYKSWLSLQKQCGKAVQCRRQAAEGRLLLEVQYL